MSPPAVWGCCCIRAGHILSMTVLAALFAPFCTPQTPNSSLVCPSPAVLSNPGSSAVWWHCTECYYEEMSPGSPSCSLIPGVHAVVGPGPMDLSLPLLTLVPGQGLG